MDSKIKPDIIKPKGQEAERRLCQLRVSSGENVFRLLLANSASHWMLNKLLFNQIQAYYSHSCWQLQLEYFCFVRREKKKENPHDLWTIKASEEPSANNFWYSEPSNFYLHEVVYPRFV